MQIHSAISAMPYSLVRQPDAQGQTMHRIQADGADKAAMPDPAGGVEEAQPLDRSTEPVALEQDLTDEDLLEVALLAQRDAEVRAHEMAHIAAGGPYVTGGASYSYQTGPDGRRYAIGGEVGIDTSMDSEDPAENIAKARIIARAALAPAEPSGQDLQVAAAARAMEINAQRELTELQQTEREAMTEQVHASRESDAASADTADAGEGDVSERQTFDGRTSDGASVRLEQRIAGFFSVASGEGLSQFA